MYLNIKRLMICVTLVTSLLLSPVTLTAQVASAPSSDWSQVIAVQSGSKLVIRLKNGTTVDGKLTSANDTALLLSVKNNPMEIKRSDVLSVYQISKKSATKATLIGLAVGLARALGLAWREVRTVALQRSTTL